MALWSDVAVAVPTGPGEIINPLAESSSCQLCHTHDNAAGAQDEPLYAAFYGWQGSLMANSARDPIFWAGVALADQDHPGETVDCVRCHVPRAFLEDREQITSIDQLESPADFEGVGCTLCHRMVDEGELFNARYALDDMMSPDGLIARRGPWSYEGEKGSPGSPPHSWIQDSFVASSQMCGTCHDVTTERERVDDDGMPMGVGFNEQRTYSEWAGSVYAQPGPDFRSCQDCHMPPVEDKPGCNQFVNRYSHPTGGLRHDMLGANRFMVELLKAEYGNAGTGDVNDFFFNLALERMDEFIATAASLELSGPPEVDLGQGLDGLTVRVTNNTGHKLPSGYSEGRVMWLEVAARYGGTVIWSSGERTPAGGFDPQDSQLRTYQGVAEQFSSGQQLHLLLNDHWIEDTRIPPQGMLPDLQTDPVGPRYTLQDDGTWPHFDVAPYAFAGRGDVADATPDDATDDVLEVQVRLLYLINTPEYVQLLADDNVTNEAGNDVAMLFDTMGGAPPVVLAESAISVPIIGFGAPPAASTGPADTTAAPPDSSGEEGPGNGSGNVGTSPPATGADSETGSPGHGDGGAAGCGCRTRGGANAPLWWMLGSVGALARRRRRLCA